MVGRQMEAKKKLDEMILLEMICRVVKNELNQQMRDTIKEIHVPVTQPFDEVVIEYYNKMLSSLEFWTNHIKEMITKKFGPDALTQTEKDPQK
jgi:hypothetical protein